MTLVNVNFTKAICCARFDSVPGDILPGGAAAALYGVRAANSVVVVTTKAGGSRASKKGVEVTTHPDAIEQIANLPDYQNKYALVRKETMGKRGPGLFYGSRNG